MTRRPTAQGAADTAGPFPGMDPYIEESGPWGGFDLNVTVGISDTWKELMPPGYVACVDVTTRAARKMGPPHNHFGYMAARSTVTRGVPVCKGPKEVTRATSVASRP